MNIQQKCENRGLDKDLFQDLVTMFYAAPARKHTDMELSYLGNGASGISMQVKKDHENTQGILQGGIIAALCDSTMGIAAKTLGAQSVTVEMNINYLVAIPIGSQLIAQGTVLRGGRITIVAEASVYLEDELVAKSRGTFYVMKQLMDRT